MPKGISRLSLCAAVALLGGLFVADALGEIKGRYRVYLVSKQSYEGELSEVGNEYRLIVPPGIEMKFRKTEVVRLVPLGDAADNATPTDALRRRLTPQEIDEILGSEPIELSAFDADDSIDLRGELAVDQRSLSDMLQKAGPKGKVYETPHFVLVYTSDLDKARALGSRLESVYEWNVKVLEWFEIPKVLPEAKLEIFFFGTFEEYDAYQTLNGFRMMGAIGFYMPTVNRSAFFDMMTWPPYAGVVRTYEDPATPAQQRRVLKNKLERIVEHQNLEVVQHEAAHHIHFNIGTFPRAGDLPRWMVEGFATMFETVPSDAGASLGSLNHYRLFHFRRFWGPKGERLPPMKQFITDDGLFGGFEGYLVGWALNHYLLNRHREKYGEWLNIMAARESNKSVEATELLAEFENLFGEVNDEWVKNFNEFIAGLVLRPSLLPPDL